jgi:hypothetical protein
LVQKDLRYLYRRTESRGPAKSPERGAILEMILTEQEIAYLRRFCWEVFHQENGPDTTFNQCRGHYNDLADLAATTNLAQEIVETAYAMDYQDTPPPVVPFPWESLDHLHQRARESTLHESLA